MVRCKLRSSYGTNYLPYGKKEKVKTNEQRGAKGLKEREEGGKSDDLPKTEKKEKRVAVFTETGRKEEGKHKKKKRGVGA